jgi:hypothetical protein
MNRTARPSTLQKAALALAAACALAACSRQPLVASDTHTPETPPKLVVEPGAPPCTLQVAELIDARASPEMFGVVDGRAIYAPKDIPAWLRSVVDGLRPRGVTPRFDAAADAEPAMLEGRIALTTAWLSNVRGNITSTAILHVRARNAAGGTVDEFYRGSVARILWWSDPSEAQEGIDDALSRALDAAAADLRQLCKG